MQISLSSAQPQAWSGTVLALGIAEGDPNGLMRVQGVASPGAYSQECEHSIIRDARYVHSYSILFLYILLRIGEGQAVLCWRGGLRTP